MRKFKVPTAYTILFIIIIIIAAFTWIIPTGEYDYAENPDGTLQPIPGSYSAVEPNGQNIFDVILSSFEGFYQAVDIALFILMVGGFLGIVVKTGAIDAGIARIITRLNGKEKYLIPILMFVFGLGGTTFGMWEETIAFFPLLIPVFILAGYDAVVAVSVIILGAGMGVFGSTVNPFATGIASGFAGISLGDGIVTRLIAFLIAETLAIFFVMRYAAKVKADPTKSIIYDKENADLKHFHAIDTEAIEPLDGKKKLVLVIFALTFLIMTYSVIPFDDVGITFLPTLAWWFSELSGLFFVSAIIIGLVYRMPEAEIATNFIAGAADLLGVAFIIGISRGITVIMNNGYITDTILHYGETLLADANSYTFILLILAIYLALSFLIPSSSGLATLSIPILVPLGAFALVPESLIITAFQFGSGIVNLMTPASALLLGGLAIANVPYEKWLKFALPFIGILILLAIAILLIATLL